MKTSYILTFKDGTGKTMKRKASTWGRAASQAATIVDIMGEVSIMSVQSEDAPKTKEK